MCNRFRTDYKANCIIHYTKSHHSRIPIVQYVQYLVCCTYVFCSETLLLIILDIAMCLNQFSDKQGKPCFGTRLCLLLSSTVGAGFASHTPLMVKKVKSVL